MKSGLNQTDNTTERGDHPAVRRPMLWATTALALGILTDEFVALHLTAWICITALTLVVSFVSFHKKFGKSFSELSLLLVLIALGGLRHHQFQNIRATDSIGRFATVAAQPARVSGVICSEIERIKAEQGTRIPPWMEVDTSRFRFEIESINDGLDWKVCAGVVSVDVSGHLMHVQIGDRVELLGELSMPSEVKNPGGFDFKEYLQRQGIDATIRCQHPQAVSLVEDSGPWRWHLARVRVAFREEARQLFTANLSKSSKSIALSLLLGDRSQLNEEVRDQFKKSGAMHLLAISGLHVGILAGLVALLCRCCAASIRTTQLLMLTSIIAFAFITNHRPPVLRATLLISVLILGVRANRRIDGFNSLAFCAGILLLWKPTDLFDIGAQLSFLAVGAIIWSSSLLQKQVTLSDQELTPSPENRRWLEVFRPLFRVVYQCYFVTGAIWLSTLPLTIAIFHLVAPIGYLLNLFLVPYAALTLSFGYLFLLAGLLVPYTAALFSAPFDYLVHGLLLVVQKAQELPFSHFHCGGIETWWLSGFYVLLALTWGLYSGSRVSNQWWKLLVLWIALGMLLPGKTTQHGCVRYCVLSVGHGLASVIELPGGETILYDAGTFGDGRRAERTVENYLRTRKIQHLDAIVVSHADHDHFSALFGLLDTFSVGTIFVSQPFLDFTQSSVSEFCELAAKKGIPIRIVKRGDQLFPRESNSDDDAILTVLHPASDFHAKSDNANSTVLSIEFADRKLLLTGDLEKEGVAALTNTDAGGFDVVIAPHHGSKHSSPQAFFDWSQSKYVIVSSGKSEVTRRLQNQLGDESTVYGTPTSGAITVEISENGELTVIPFIESDE